jgi:hypothetical protein
VNEPDARHSGSRWEPAAGAAPTAPVPAADPGYRTAELPQSGQPGDTAAPYAATAGQEMPATGTSRRLPGRLRRRVATGVAAVALVAAGGVGGFAIGQAAAGDDATVTTGTVTDDGGAGDDGTDDGDGFPDHGRFGGGPPPGFDDGTAPDGDSTDDGDPA